MWLSKEVQILKAHDRGVNSATNRKLFKLSSFEQSLVLQSTRALLPYSTFSRIKRCRTERGGRSIDALRRGTVPQKGLDTFALGMDRFEGTIESELDVAAAGGSPS